MQVDGTCARHPHAGGWHLRTHDSESESGPGLFAGIRFFSHCDCGWIRSGRLLPDNLLPEDQIAGAGES